MILLITVGIFWYLYRDVPGEQILNELQHFDYRWILLSIALSIVSHVLRAWRWKLLLEQSGSSVKLLNNYFAVMIGYLANSIFPRLGEVTRCGIINRVHHIPVTFSFGTVFTERLVDLMLLLVLALITFSIEFDLLEPSISNLYVRITETFANNWLLLLLLILIFVTGIYLVFFSRRFREIKLMKRISGIIKEVIQGVLSIRKVKNQMGFWSATIAIWGLYFLMMYVISFGSESTKDLSAMAGLSILVMGSFGMAAPTPNGTGTFHAFVTGVLLLYGIPEAEGKIFALILHTSQFITVLVFGSISLILVNLMNKGNDETVKGKNTQPAGTS